MTGRSSPDASGQVTQLRSSREKPGSDAPLPSARSARQGSRSDRPPVVHRTPADYLLLSSLAGSALRERRSAVRKCLSLSRANWAYGTEGTVDRLARVHSSVGLWLEVTDMLNSRAHATVR